MVELFNLFHQQHSDSGLVFVGKGPLEDEIKQKVSALGLNMCVYFCGQQDTVGEYYQAVDVFLFPSLYEGFGLSLLEAEVNGLRCICSTSIPEEPIITDYVEKLPIDSKSIQIWADHAITYALSGRNNKEIDNFYNLMTQSVMLVDFYENIE